MNTENTIAAEIANIAEVIASTKIEFLGEKAKNPEIVAKLNEIIEKLNSLSDKPVKAKDRGPDSQREMTEDDARRVILGDLKDFSHKNAASELGLSYGQVYSARKGFTFKEVNKEANK